MARIHSSITDLIGDTPLIELGRYAERRELTARLLAKVEYFNPAGSVKDRAAWAIIREAEASGALQPGGRIVDITSGNTGIALAAIAARRGYRTTFYLGDNISPDKVALLRAYGAELEVVPNSFLADPANLPVLVERVEAENPDAFFANQLGNPANPQAHFDTTGPEIWADTDGEVDILVGGIGTGGTVSGAGRFLKGKKPAVRVVVAEPGLGSLPTPENLYPAEIDGVHKVTEVESDFLPENFDASVPDEIVALETQQAREAARALAREEGLLVGTSSGAALWVATELARRPENAGATIVVVFPDTGERYLSAGTFGTLDDAETLNVETVPA
ncbi:PLP-dependent cysteine synthase family protein [Rathayibacter sp. CAU 1779]